ncbi:hypothetical protein CLOP_g4706 [Closterium sp. NIES-67]|nr:hypothetical protein CLOP_g4706 [Closterium sp. NIES-67]
MDSPTHIHDLPDDILTKILWHYEQRVPRKSDSDALWESDFLIPTPKYISARLSVENAIREETRTPLPTPPPSANAHLILIIASVCCRWRRLAQRCTSALYVRDNLAVSRQDLAGAVASLPHLTHLHLCDGSVETLDDAFLAHLASCCPKLAILHVGSRIAPEEINHHDYGHYRAGRKDEHPITDAGLDRFFTRSTQLEQLSLYCLHVSATFPASFFHLPRLHTLSLASAFPLQSPHFASLTSLTSLTIVSGYLDYLQLQILARLPSITSLSVSDQTRFAGDEHGSADLDLAQLPRLKSLKFNQLLPLASPCTSIERLDILQSDPKDLPSDFGHLLPRLRELIFRQSWYHWSPPEPFRLPETFPSLTLLESLTLSKCDLLGSLPENFGCLPTLKTLVLHKLRLSSLPDSLCQLASLQTFLLMECASTPVDTLQLPAGFCCLTALQTLCLAKMPRVRLPENIGELAQLRTVFLSGLYQQPRLPASFTQLSSLTRLELGTCMLRELPEDLGVGSLANLQELHIHSCPLLQRLPDSLTRLTGLEVLTVDECVKLTSIPRRLEGLGKLKWLELTGCRYQTEPPACLPLSLEVLDLGNSYRVADLPDVSLLPKLRKLSLKLVGKEERMAVTSSFPHLQHLELHLQDDALQLPFPLALLPQLHSLVIWNAGKVQRLPCDIGSALPQLRSLQIHRAGELQELPESIGALTRLRQLHLFDCPALQHLPASLTRLACLHKLSVGSATIRSLPAGFVQLTRLRRLDLNGCEQLRALPQGLADLTMLRYLGVKDCWHVRDDRGHVVEPRGIDSMYGLRIE